MNALVKIFRVAIEGAHLLYLLAKRKLTAVVEVWRCPPDPLQRSRPPARGAVDIVLSVRRHEQRAYGLKADADIFQRGLRDARIVNGYGPRRALQARWRLFIEEIPRRPALLDGRHRHALMINVENAMHHIAVLGRMQLVLCKNQHTFDLLTRYRQGGRRYRYFGLEESAADSLIREGNRQVAEFDAIRHLLPLAGRDPRPLDFELKLTRFTSRRILPEEAARHLIATAPCDRAVHFASSRHKHTLRIIETYLAYPDLPDLVIVSSISGYLEARLGRAEWRRLVGGGHPRIRIVEGPVAAEEQRLLFQTHRIHLCPSASEGYGHYINEARGAGCLVVTTAAPPMNELIDAESGYLVPVTTRAKVGSFGSEAVDFAPAALAATLGAVRAEAPERQRRRAERALQAYRDDTAFFFQAMEDLNRRFAEP